MEKGNSIEYVYDKEGNRRKEIRYDNDDNVEWIYEYGYDAAGNKTEEICGNGIITVAFRYEYVYRLE